MLFNGPSENLWEFCKPAARRRPPSVSNAGTGDGGPLAEIPIDLVRRTFETNVFANLALTQHVVLDRRAGMTGSEDHRGSYAL